MRSHKTLCPTCNAGDNRSTRTYCSACRRAHVRGRSDGEAGRKKARSAALHNRKARAETSPHLTFMSADLNSMPELSAPLTPHVPSALARSSVGLWPERAIFLTDPPLRSASLRPRFVCDLRHAPLRVAPASLLRLSPFLFNSPATALAHRTYFTAIALSSFRASPANSMPRSHAISRCTLQALHRASEATS